MFVASVVPGGMTITTKAQVAKRPTLTTTNGGVHFAKARFLFYPTKQMFVRMHQLHLRAHMDASAKDARRHRTTSAKFFRRALECALANYLVVADEIRLAFSGHLLDAIEQIKGFGGLESLFLTAMGTAGHLGQTALWDRGAKLWAQLGAPKLLGGALKAALVVDTTNKRVAYIGAAGLASLAPGGANASILASGHMNDVYSSVTSRVSGLDAGIAQDGDGACVTIFSMGGGLVGGVVGGILGKKAGSTKVGEALGHEVGAEAGKALGGAICGAFDSGTMVGTDGAGGARGDDGVTGSETTGTDDASNQSQSSSSSDDKSTCEPDDPDDGDTGGDDSGSGNDDNSSGNKDDDPDDIMPVPPEVGDQLMTLTYAMGAGVASHMSHLAGGGILLTGTAQLAVNGRVVTAGIAASVGEAAQRVAQQAAERVATSTIDAGALANANRAATAARP